MPLASLGVVAAQLDIRCAGMASYARRRADDGPLDRHGGRPLLAAVLCTKDSWRAGIPKQDKTGPVTGGVYAFSRNPTFPGRTPMDLSAAPPCASLLAAAFHAFAAAPPHLQLLRRKSMKKHPPERIKPSGTVLAYPKPTLTMANPMPCDTRDNAPCGVQSRVQGGGASAPAPMRQTLQCLTVLGAAVKIRRLSRSNRRSARQKAVPGARFLQDEGLHPARQGCGNDAAAQTLRKVSRPAKPGDSNEKEGTVPSCPPARLPAAFGGGLKTAVSRSNRRHARLPHHFLRP